MLEQQPCALVHVGADPLQRLGNGGDQALGHGVGFDVHGGAGDPPHGAGGAGLAGVAAGILHGQAEISHPLFSHADHGHPRGDAERRSVGDAASFVDHETQPHAALLQSIHNGGGAGIRSQHLFVVPVAKVDIAGGRPPLGQKCFHGLHLGQKLALVVQHAASIHISVLPSEGKGVRAPERKIAGRHHVKMRQQRTGQRGRRAVSLPAVEQRGLADHFPGEMTVNQGIGFLQIVVQGEKGGVVGLLRIRVRDRFTGDHAGKTGEDPIVVKLHAVPPERLTIFVFCWRNSEKI